MIIHNTLNELFSARSNISVLRTLNQVRIGLSGREIARRAGLSPSTCKETLLTLESLNTIIRQMGGREHLISLNRESFLVREIVIPALRKEAEIREEINYTIAEEIGTFAESIILFGSTARDEEQTGSDYDICIVYTVHSNRLRIEKKISALYSGLRNMYGISLDPFYITKNEFYQRFKKNKQPVPDIVKDGILVSGMKIRELING